MPASRPAWLTAGAAVVLMLPSLLFGTLPSHSSLHNLTWAAQFTEQFRSGVLYPRWLADSFDGLGAPSFYFYPPLAFWVDALLSVLTFDVLSTSYRLSVATMLLLWVSGLGMYGWLRGEAVAPRIALFGALGYMAAPYHLVDHYIRGAIAEFAAYSVLPLVICGVALVARRRRGGLALVAVSYAALVMSHLPTALLISLTAIPAYVLFVAVRARQTDRWFVLRCGAGFALGLGLAAIYLVPALTLQAAVRIEWLWVSGFKVEDGFLLMPGRWIQPPYMFWIIASIAAAWLLATVALLLPGRARQGRIVLWARVGLVSLVLMSGVLPWFWQWVPMVSKVGFPWRLLIVVEFAVITALCLWAWPVRERVPRLIVWLAVIAAVPAVVVMGSGIADRVNLARKGEVPAPQDAREYLPAGYPDHQRSSGYAELGLEPTKDLPTIACVPAPRLCRAEPGRFGALRLDIDSDMPVKVTVRRFAFPAWQLEPPLPLVASEPLRLVSFDAPAGHGSYRLERRFLPNEQWGWALSGASLALLLLLSAGTAILRPRFHDGVKR